MSVIIALPLSAQSELKAYLLLPTSFSPHFTHLVCPKSRVSKPTIRPEKGLIPGQGGRFLRSRFDAPGGRCHGRLPLRSIHPSELRSFGSRSQGRGRPWSARAILPSLRYKHLLQFHHPFARQYTPLILHPVLASENDDHGSTSFAWMDLSLDLLFCKSGSRSGPIQVSRISFSVGRRSKRQSSLHMFGVGERSCKSPATRMCSTGT